IPDRALTGVAEVDAVLRGRATEEAERERVRGGGAAAVRDGVALALGRLARTHDAWRVRPQLEVDPEVFAGLDDTRDPVLRRPDGPRLPDGLRPVPLPPPHVPVVTTPRPYLRWHPVPPPTLVARRPLG